MKVLITAPSLNEKDNVSGISTLISSIIANNSSEYVHFVAGRKDGERIGPGWVVRQAGLPFRFLAALRREKPDLVHINTAFIKFAILRDCILSIIAKRAKCPILLHIHGGPYVAEASESRLVEWATKSMVKTSDRAVVFSNVEKLCLIKRYPDLRIDVLPNAISLDGIPAFEREDGEKKIIFFGRLNVSKGLVYILDACRLLREHGFKFRFECYGAGPEEKSFVSEMTALLGENFYYGGVVKGVDKWKALSQADIFFLPSRDEGLPIALLEAMAVGCVPVASASGAVSTVIDDGHNGFIIKPGDLVQTVGRLKMLLDGMVDWNDLRKNARRTVRERFDIRDYVKRLERIYKETPRN
ncbi:MAG: glycosyltransferase family 4 protein [Blastocatellia bacterium]